MRAEVPLYCNEKHDFYAVSRYRDVRDMSADWRTYSSVRGWASLPVPASLAGS